MTKQEQHRSNRTQRREAERVARKLANKEAQRQQATGVTPEAPTPAKAPEPNPISEAQLAANRANAQHSTGAKTAAGHARSAMNALKSGLTGKTVLLPHEDATKYEKDLEGFITAYGASTDEELRLVQTSVDCMWRIDRITRLETAIMLKGQLEATEHYEDRTALERAHLIDADVYLKYERQLRNLHIQEARLRRTLEKTQKALKQAQVEREEREQLEMQYAERHQARTAAAPATTTANGFEFSTAPEPSYSSQPQQS